MIEQTTEHIKQPQTTLRGKKFVLEIVDGPERGRHFEISLAEPSRVLVGSSSLGRIAIDDRLVSRRHAAIEVDGTYLRLTDLGSRNGTFVNGLRVVEVLLVGGEAIRMGSSLLRVEAVGEADVSLPSETHFGRMIGASVEMRRLYPLCDLLAKADVPVLIEGETGTGKEVLAEALHEMGPRRDGPFVVFDCTGVAPTLVEAELFGHERGAFTGADAARKGLFEAAHGGTLLIDELGDLPLACQAKLLRVVERKEVRRVGGDKVIAVDVRILSATRRNLDIEVQSGRFRDDLFHRLAVARIELPPLRRRSGDVALLARRFWESLGGAASEFPTEELPNWESETWAGNMRELRNAVARRLALGYADQDNALGASPEGRDMIAHILDLDLAFPRARDEVVAEFERRFVERTLKVHGGNVTRAAAASGIGRRYFQYILKRAK